MPLAQTGVFYSYSYYETLIGNLVLEAKLTGQRGRLATKSG